MELTLSKIRKYYNVPIVEACVKLGLCETIMKKMLRSLGVKRWPKRKIHAILNILVILRMRSEETLLGVRLKNDNNEKELIIKDIENYKSCLEIVMDDPDINFNLLIDKQVLQKFSKIKLQFFDDLIKREQYIQNLHDISLESGFKIPSTVSKSEVTKSLKRKLIQSDDLECLDQNSVNDQPLINTKSLEHLAKIASLLDSGPNPFPKSHMVLRKRKQEEFVKFQETLPPIKYVRILK